MTRTILAVVLALGLAACGDWSPPAAAPVVPTTASPTSADPTTVAPTSAVPTTVPPTTATSATTNPPTAAGRYAPTGMVDITDFDASIIVSVGKATSDNVTGAPVAGYEANRAFLPPDAARALAQVQRGLASRNLGLKVWDAYRPVRATQALVAWARSIGRSDLIGPYIASVSYHNSGQAVDLTLVERATGRELDMGTGYDEFSPRANTANATGVAAANRAILLEAMEAEGFESYSGEWWHFYYYMAGLPNLDEPVR